MYVRVFTQAWGRTSHHGHLGAGIMQDSAHSTQATGTQVRQGGPYPVGEVDWGLTPYELRIQDPHLV